MKKKYQNVNYLSTVQKGPGEDQIQEFPYVMTPFNLKPATSLLQCWSTRA